MHDRLFHVLKQNLCFDDIKFTYDVMIQWPIQGGAKRARLPPLKVRVRLGR